ncbi:MAG: CatB-related O-acetyltransferase [Arachnia sp.]
MAVGRGTYGRLNVVDDGGDSCLTIGAYCSIADDVVFLLNADHPIDRLSTYPFAVKYFHSQRTQATSKGDIVVGPDCWIGYGASILSGVTLGQGVVVAAGAVVATSIPAFAIVGGVPAKVLRYRFSEDIRNELLERDFSEVLEHILETDPSALDRSVDADLMAVIRAVPKRNAGGEQ